MRYFSTFSGIGGFELGIQLAYEIIRDSDVSKERGGKGTQTVDDANGQRLHPVSNETAISATNGDNEYFNRSLDQGQPYCVGFSEIDKYATSIYQSHFPEHKNYGDITQIDETTLPDFDLLVGGVPCQSWSIAGKRGGFEDERGNMWFQYAKILRAKQPKYFIAENVKGLLSHDGGKSMEKICEELCACGYAIDFEVLNSKNFGVPQNRERVIIVGIRFDLLDECQVY